MRASRKAIETIALGYSEGIVPIDALMKACENYKLKKNLLADEEYEKMVSKSFFDQMNGIKTADKILKAVVPGQTKYFDGVLYVYSATKTGSKTDYAWHVADKTKVGKGSTLTPQQKATAQDSVNQLFPVDLKSLSVVKDLGGSTGAKLVKDVSGNEYVMKRVDKVKNPSGNADHVRSEYMANMLYNILGQRTPDYELYDADTDDPTLLSRFIPGTREPQSNDFAKMGEGFIADVLLANWDVYRNDNCRIDAGGNVIRVDNGGCLAFRAQGKLKQPPFDGDVKRTFKDMLQYNSLLAKCLSDEDLLNQIDAVLKKKDDVVEYLKTAGDDNLAKIFAQRIDGLKGIRDEIQFRITRKANLAAAKAGKIAKRDLLPKTEMYRELDEKELSDIFDEVIAMSSSRDSALTKTDETGWSILSRICQTRGFDARPRVVTDDEFWKEAAKADLPIMFRGQQSSDGKSGAEYCDMFRFDDQCYYGTQGIWGQGIYAHTDDTNNVWNGSQPDKYDPKDDVNNHSNQANFKASRAYYDATSYAHFEDGGVIKMAWEKGAKVVNLEDLLKEIKSNPPTIKDKNVLKEIKQLQKELHDAKTEWTDAEVALQNVSGTIRKDVERKMHYDAAAITEMYNDINGTNWGNRTAQGKLSYPSFDTFVVGKMADWVKRNGGKVQIDPDFVVFEIGGRTESITKIAWENNAIKQKNALTQPYNYQAERFKAFMETNCISRVEKAFQTALRDSKTVTAKMQLTAEEKKKEYYRIEGELNTKMAANVDDSLQAAIYDRVKDIDSREDGSRMSVVGIYAAIKGYDGIYIHNGNGWSHGFNVILNRSKVIASIE